MKVWNSAVVIGARKPPPQHGERVCSDKVVHERVLRDGVELCLDLRHYCSIGRIDDGRLCRFIGWWVI